jgi:hypothetical protein
MSVDCSGPEPVVAARQILSAAAAPRTVTFEDVHEEFTLEPTGGLLGRLRDPVLGHRRHPALPFQ